MGIQHQRSNDVRRSKSEMRQHKDDASWMLLTATFPLPLAQLTLTQSRISIKSSQSLSLQEPEIPSTHLNN